VGLCMFDYKSLHLAVTNLTIFVTLADRQTAFDRLHLIILYYSASALLAMQSALLATAVLSICLSVRHVLVFLIV